MLRVAARNVNKLDAARRRLTPVREPYLRARQAFVRNTPRRCAQGHRGPLRPRRRPLRADARPVDDVLLRAVRAAGDDARAGVDGQARADLRQARPAADRPPAGDRHGLGLAGAARRPLARLPGDHDDDLQGPARDRRAARARGRARGPRDRAAGGLPRPHRHLRQARVGRDDRGRRLEGLRHVLRALQRAAGARRRDAAAGDHDGRPRLPDRARLAQLHPHDDLPQRLPARRRR